MGFFRSLPRRGHVVVLGSILAVEVHMFDPRPDDYYKRTLQAAILLVLILLAAYLSGLHLRFPSYALH